MQQAFSQVQLTQLGLELIDESTEKCPLCDAPWRADELREHLEKRLSFAQIAVNYQERIRELSATLSAPVNSTTASLAKVIEAAKSAALRKEAQLLQAWLDDLQMLATALTTPIEKYPDPAFDEDKIKKMLCPANISETLVSVHIAVKDRYPQIRPEQTAWDTLTRLEENLKALENAKETLKNAHLTHERARTLCGSFEKARDEVLGQLYLDISDRFASPAQKPVPGPPFLHCVHNPLLPAKA